MKPPQGVQELASEKGRTVGIIFQRKTEAYKEFYLKMCKQCLSSVLHWYFLKDRLTQQTAKNGCPHTKC